MIQTSSRFCFVRYKWLRVATKEAIYEDLSYISSRPKSLTHVLISTSGRFGSRY